MSDKPCPLCGREMTAIETHAGRGELYCGHCDLVIGGNEAKTPDELMELLGQSTCQGHIDEEYVECSLVTFNCMSCGWEGVVDTGFVSCSFEESDMPKYCPNCGRKVVDE